MGGARWAAVMCTGVALSSATPAVAIAPVHLSLASVVRGTRVIVSGEIEEVRAAGDWLEWRVRWEERLRGDPGEAVYARLSVHDASPMQGPDGEWEAPLILRSGLEERLAVGDRAIFLCGEPGLWRPIGTQGEVPHRPTLSCERAERIERLEEVRGAMESP